VPAGATKIIAEATRFADGVGLKVCPVHFGERAAFHRSSATGEVAQEADPEGKAAREVDALWKWTCKQLGINIPGLHDAVRDAGQWIIDNQSTKGSWDYSYAESEASGGRASGRGSRAPGRRSRASS